MAYCLPEIPTGKRGHIDCRIRWEPRDRVRKLPQQLGVWQRDCGPPAIQILYLSDRNLGEGKNRIMLKVGTR